MTTWIEANLLTVEWQVMISTCTGNRCSHEHCLVSDIEYPNFAEAYEVARREYEHGAPHVHMFPLDGSEFYLDIKSNGWTREEL